MSELKFALKCFVFTLLITFLMQIKIAGYSIETRAEYYLKRSQLTDYLQIAADGGARILQEGYYITKNFVLDLTGSSRRSHEMRSNR